MNLPFDFNCNWEELNASYAARHRDLLVSNHSIPDIEEKALEELHVLERNVVDIKDTVAALFRMQDGIQRAIELRKAVVSPIRKLPNEILRNIFIEAHTGAEWQAFDIGAIPWVVAQVCSRWREISCSSSPRLWSSFKCSGGKEDAYTTNFSRAEAAERCRRQSDLVKALLQRSGNSPLTFNFELHWQSDSHRIFDVATALFSHSLHWKDVEFIDFGGGYFPKPMLASLRGQMPQLERLKMRWSNGSESIEAFSVAPRLRELDITVGDHVISAKAFPWSQLKILRLRCGAWHQLLAVLVNCGNLVECELHFRTMLFDLNPPPIQPVGAFNNLRILHCEAAALFIFGSMPVLEELHLASGTDLGKALTGRDSGRILSQLKLLSIPALKSAEYDAASSLLKACTAVTTLHLQYPSGGSNDLLLVPIIKSLLIDPANPTRAVLPLLQHLKVGIQKKDDDRWVQTIQSRYFSPAQSVERLKSFHACLCFCRDSQRRDDMKIRLKEAEEKGLLVSLEWD
ncbi:hypothetical protein C8J56DRAFT_834602 [Mycena floridula]|nr:hypothetical protein C8J56DRAFT_834602 [Mycena floridula]